MQKSHKEHLTQKLKNLPNEPGVYLYKNDKKEIIYIGKALSLKKRVSSYFQKNIPDIKTLTLVRNIADLDTIITETEIEALLLEDSLIKKHKPRFNIRLKDDKRYPYIALTYSEDYPRAVFTRNLKNKDNKYFGPYTDAQAARSTVQLITRIFRLKSCTKKLPLKNGERPCLNNQIKQCSGICENKITRDEYLEYVKNAERFLEGEIEPVIETLNERMQRYSEDMKFEKAADMRDMIYDIQKISSRQNVTMPQTYNIDYIGIETFQDEAIVLVFEFRKGALLGKKIHIYENTRFTEKDSVLRTFILNHYKNEIPHILVSSRVIDDSKLIEEYLKKQCGHNVSVTTAKSSADKSALSLVSKNIDSVIAEKMAADAHKSKNIPLINLKNILNLPEVPIHMVCFDISNIQGTNAVASMASFKHGEPDKAGYRRFKIRSLDTPNDPAMMHEATGRYFQHIANNDEKWERPDLVVIDGGPTQLTRALEARDAFGLDIPVISIAKRIEELFVHPGKGPVLLSHDSQELKIIQRLRDATHDFGVSYHRKLRDKSTFKSELDGVPGIGPKKRALLLKVYSGVKEIAEKPIEELSALEGISAKDAEAVYSFFHKEKE